MSAVFFKQAPEAPTRAKCSKCGLYRKCESPKMQPTGKGQKKILLVAEAPGKNEDKEGTQLIGQSGQLVRKHLRSRGIDMDRDCWKTNAIICFPKGTPTNKQLDYCFPNLRETVLRLKPEVVITLGGKAIHSLIGWLWKPNPGKMERWAGWKIPDRKINSWVCPTYHPAYLLRNPNPTLERAFNRHLGDAVALKGRPYSERRRDWSKEVVVLESSDEAVAVIQQWLKEKPRLMAFDFETDRLKPDSGEASIFCCSISSELGTYAFSWDGAVPQAMSEVFQDKRIGKIAANLKFEHRWVKRRLGIDVEGWCFDTMLAAHVLDNRKGITGLKFQVYARLGQGSYDSDVEPYLKAPHGNTRNRIHKADRKDVLLYCGMDSLLEHKLAQLQMEDLGISV